MWRKPLNVGSWGKTNSIYQVLPQIIELWGLNTQTDAEAKKNFAQLTGK